MFSATLPPWVDHLSNKYMRPNKKTPIDLLKDKPLNTPKDIEHYSVIFSQKHHNLSQLINSVIQTLAIKGSVIIFCEKKVSANSLYDQRQIKKTSGILHG